MKKFFTPSKLLLTIVLYSASLFASSKTNKFKIPIQELKFDTRTMIADYAGINDKKKLVL